MQNLLNCNCTSEKFHNSHHTSAQPLIGDITQQTYIIYGCSLNKQTSKRSEFIKFYILPNFFFRLTAMEFLSGFRSNCSFYYLDRGLYFSVLPRRRCQEFTYSELVSVHSYSFLSSPSGSFTELEFLMSKGKEFSITMDNTTGPQRTQATPQIGATKIG